MLLARYRLPTSQSISQKGLMKKTGKLESTEVPVARILASGAFLLAFPLKPNNAQRITQEEL